MKKILLGTSAVVGAALVASTASAQDPIQIGIGGGMTHALTADWQSGSEGGTTGNPTGNFQDAAINIIQDWNLDFAGSTTLENGLTIGAFIELDESGGAANIDEVYMSVSGGFGTFLLGDLQPAADGAVVGNINGGSAFALDDGNFELGGNGSVAQSPMARDVVGPGEEGSLAYATPTFAGFSGVVSYTPDANEARDNPSQADSTAEDIWSFALGYENAFGPVDLAVGFGSTLGNVEAGGNDHFSYTAGVEVGFAGFTLGGGYSYGSGLGTIGGGEGDTNLYEERGTASLGLGYAIDKVSVAVSGMYGWGDVDASVSNIANASETDRAWGVQLDGAYALGPGITWGAGFGMTSHNFSTNGANGLGAANDPDGIDITSYGIGTSLDISF